MSGVVSALMMRVTDMLGPSSRPASYHHPVLGFTTHVWSVLPEPRDCGGPLVPYVLSETAARAAISGLFPETSREVFNMQLHNNFDDAPPLQPGFDPPFFAGNGTTFSRRDLPASFRWPPGHVSLSQLLVSPSTSLWDRRLRSASSFLSPLLSAQPAEGPARPFTSRSTEREAAFGSPLPPGVSGPRTSLLRRVLLSLQTPPLWSAPKTKSERLTALPSSFGSALPCRSRYGLGCHARTNQQRLSSTGPRSRASPTARRGPPRAVERSRPSTQVDPPRCLLAGSPR